MESKISLRMMEEEKDEERQPLNAMVTENLKNIIIRKIYKDVERNVGAQKKNASPTVHQYLAALGPIFGALSSGMSAGYSAILLPQLMAEDTEIAITKDEGSWIASMLALPLIFGCLVSGYIMDSLGRKNGQILSCIPYTIGWIVLAFSPNVPALYVGRFITGFCVGLIAPMCQVYVAETSQPENRGILLSGAPLAVALGIFAAHILGTFFTWRITAGICGIPPIINIILLIFSPESPSWLLSRGKIDAAEKSFLWFRGDSEEATKEFNVLLNKTRNPDEEDQNAGVPKWKLCLKSSFLKPFLVLNFFFFVQQFSGVNAVAFYSINILKDVLTSMNEYVATILIDVVRFIASVIGIVLLKRYGRKPLSVVSAIGTAISLFALAIYLGCINIQNLDDSDLMSPLSNFTSANELDISNSTSPLRNFTSGNELNISTSTALLSNFTSANETSILDDEIIEIAPDILYMIQSYLPMVFLIMYISFVSIGLVPLPWVLSGELFSKEMRGIGSAGASSFGFICYFIVVKLTPDLFENLYTWGTFCLFAVVSVLGSVVLGLYLPETKDKTLMEIEAFYKRKKPKALNGVQQNGGESIQN